MLVYASPFVSDLSFIIRLLHFFAQTLLHSSLIYFYLGNVQ